MRQRDSAATYFLFVICGLLLHCSFAFSGGVFLAIVSLVLLFYAVDSCPEAGKASGIILLTLSAWHIGQYEFLICKIGSSGWQVLLVIFLSILVAWIPVCVTLIIGKDLRKSDVLMVGLLVSEFVYSKIPIGNQLFQFGVLLASFPEIIQWEKITGLYFASLWLGVLSLYLYKSIFVNPKCYRVLLFVLFVPFLVSLGIFFFSSPSSQTETTTVSVLPMKNEKDRQELYHQLQSGCFSLHYS